jgi:hypothetical protein
MIIDRNIVQGCERQPAGAAGGLADHDPGGDHQAEDHQAQRYRSRPAPSPRGNNVSISLKYVTFLQYSLKNFLD